MRLGGFTLLELLVVLSMVALVVGLVGPSTWRQLQAARERGAVSDVEAALVSLPLQAFRRGERLSVSGEALAGGLAEPLPDGWRLEADPPLAYGPQGIAQGGQVRLRDAAGIRARWSIAPLTGEVRRLP